MKKMMFLLSCVYVALCFLPALSLAAETNEGKSESATVEPGKKEKETSLYLYYQKYLNPYLNKNRTKTEDRSRATEQKGSLASNPSTSPLSDKSKTNDSRAVQNEAPDRPYVTLNRLDSIGLDAVNKTFPQAYRKEYLAELALGVKLSPLVDLSVGKVQKFERSGDSPWGAHDDGWRLRLQKNF
jgi:hypothetical protein